MSRRTVTVSVGKPRVGLGRILLHTFLTCATGGFWLIILAIRYLLR